MLIKRGGEIKSGEITEKALYLNRRAFMTGAGAGAAGLALAPGAARAAAGIEEETVTVPAGATVDGVAVGVPEGASGRAGTNSE